MTTAQRWGWGLLTVLITLSILFLLMLKADAGGYCQQGGRHCDTTTTTQLEESTTSSSTTTTTLPEEPSTTTTAPPTTTTTSQSSTTTTTPVTSSTVPTDNTTTTTSDPLLTLWTAGVSCQTLHADFGTGITQVDVYWRDPILGDFGPADGLSSFTESGQQMETGVNAEFILIPVVESGWTATPDQISLHTETCTPHPSTTIDPSTPPELPLTGSGTKALVAIAAAVSTLGFMVVKEAGRE